MSQIRPLVNGVATSVELVRFALETLENEPWRIEDAIDNLKVVLMLEAAKEARKAAWYEADCPPSPPTVNPPVKVGDRVKIVRYHNTLRVRDPLVEGQCATVTIVGPGEVIDTIADDGGPAALLSDWGDVWGLVT